MILAAGTMAACLVTVWLLRRHTVWVLGLIVALYVGIPAQADGLIVPFLHPGSYLTVALVLQHLVMRDRDELVRLARPGLPVVIGFVIAMSIAMLDLLNPYESDPGWLFSTVTRIFLLGFLLFPLTLIELRRRPESRRTLASILIVIALVEAVIVILQHQSDMERFVFWREYYRLSYWYDDDFPIPMGTTGHPLQMAAYVSMCIPLLARLRSPVVAVSIAGVLLYACALGTGRASTALAAVGVLFLLVWHGRRWLAAAAAAVLALVAGRRLWESNGLLGLRDKVDDDQGSARLREDALRWALEHMDEFIWFGYPGGHDLRGTGVLRSSLENGYLIAGLAFGMVFVVAIFCVHALAVLRPLSARTKAVPEVMATSFVWVGFVASSSFMAFAIDGRVFWMLAAMGWAVALPVTASEATPEQGQTDAGAADSVPTGTTPGLSAAG